MADRQRRVRRLALAGGLGTISLLGGGAHASAQEAPASCYGDGTERCAEVRGVVVGRDTGAGQTQAVAVSPAAARVAGRSSQLPVTGGDVAGLSVVGGALLLGGVAIVTGSRRRQSAAL